MKRSCFTDKRMDAAVYVRNKNMEEIIQGLFPRRTDRWEKEARVEQNEKFSMGELHEAGARLRNGRAPDPDQMTPENIKIAVSTIPEAILVIMNDLLQKQVFPKEWKVAKVVLIPKSGKIIETTSAYRPTCLLDSISQLYEHLIAARIKKELKNGGDLSRSQLGFREGRSTTDTVKKVLDIADVIRRRSGRRKNKCCVLTTIDVRNGFNSAFWAQIIKELRKKKISQYLLNIISNYLKDGKIMIEDKVMDIKAGVPQRSVSGPLLWNILYDGIFQQLGVTTIGYADDLALVIKADDQKQLKRRANAAMRISKKLMTTNCLEIVQEKKEAIVLYGPRDRSTLKFHSGGDTIQNG